MKAIYILTAAGVLALSTAMFVGCNTDSTGRTQKAAAAATSAAQQIYVAPGKLDDYYAILSGGQSGSMFVYGIPSCRFIKEIAVFEPRAGQGYANNQGSASYRRLAASGPMWVTHIIRF